MSKTRIWLIAGIVIMLFFNVAAFFEIVMKGTLVAVLFLIFGSAVLSTLIKKLRQTKL